MDRFVEGGRPLLHGRRPLFCVPTAVAAFAAPRSTLVGGVEDTITNTGSIRSTKYIVVDAAILRVRHKWGYVHKEGTLVFIARKPLFVLVQNKLYSYNLQPRPLPNSSRFPQVVCVRSPASRVGGSTRAKLNFVSIYARIDRAPRAASAVATAKTRTWVIVQYVYIRVPAVTPT